MTDWDQDEFMSEWDKKYVSTNLKQDAKKYEKDFFLGLNSRLVLSNPELESISFAIIASIHLSPNSLDFKTPSETNSQVIGSGFHRCWSC